MPQTEQKRKKYLYIYGKSAAKTSEIRRTRQSGRRNLATHFLARDDRPATIRRQHDAEVFTKPAALRRRLRQARYFFKV